MGVVHISLFLLHTLMFDYEPGAFSYPFCATPYVFRMGLVHISPFLLHTLMFDYGLGAFRPFCTTPHVFRIGIVQFPLIFAPHPHV